MIITSNLANKVKEYVEGRKDLHEIARWLINIEIHKHVPINLEDLADTSLVASEVDAIVECLQEKDYADAVNISKDSATEILSEEGFDLNNV
jgi:hypothetical protein